MQIYTYPCYRSRLNRTRGVSAIEAVIGISLMATVVLFTVFAVTRFVSIGKDQVARTQALYLTEEVMEAGRYYRDASWSTFFALPHNSNLYAQITSGAITLTATPQTVEGFTTIFRLYDVRRDTTTKDIVASGGTVDTQTLLMIATTTWNGQSIVLAQYLTDLTP